jgi:hypothetical protein
MFGQKVQENERDRIVEDGKKLVAARMEIRDSKKLPP